MVKPQILEKLHLWYARNRGLAIEQEILERLMAVQDSEAPGLTLPATPPVPS
jgi:hypothetical protein